MTRPLLLVLALAAAFGAWEIPFADFMADDLMQLGVLEGVSPAAAWTGRLELYTISDGDPAHVQAMKDAGLFPWFADPVFEMAFLRPLASALLAFDHALFGLHPAGYRLHGVLWSLALVAAAGSVLRRALPGPTGMIALLVFVLSAIHGMFCWTATRHVVIAAAFGFAAVAAHLRWREEGWRPGAALSVLALALSLAASEVGVAAAVYLIAYETLGASGTARTRVVAGAPTLAVVAAYLLLWQFLGRGASPGTGYLDPLRDPGAFLLELPKRLAVLTGGVVVGGSGVDLWVLRPDLRPLLAIAGAFVSAGFVALLRAAWREMPTAERRAARWLGVAAVASAVPFAGTPIGARCLIVPFAGGAALVAVVIERWWSAWRHRRGLRNRALGAACAALSVVHLGLAPLGRLGLPVLLQRGMAERAAAALRDAELDPATLARQTAVVLVAPDLVVGLHGGFHRVLHRLPMPAAWRVLSGGPAPHRFVRTATDTLEMEIGGGGIRSPTLRPGTVITLRGMEATVLSTGSLGPNRVRIRLDRPLDDPSVSLLAWRDERLRRVEPPPVGGVVTVHRHFIRHSTPDNGPLSNKNLNKNRSLPPDILSGILLPSMPFAPEMEPMLPSEGCVELQDRALDLVAKTSRLAGQLPGQVCLAVGDLVRSMNCHYSNLIEGHDTHPRDIDRALADDYHEDPKRRALQIEARAHIELQRKIDSGEDPPEAPTSEAYLRWLHREFCGRLPDELLWVENPDTGERLRVEAGILRDHGVQVGRHVPPAADRLTELLRRFEEAYSPARLSKSMAIVAAAAAHHRLLWIHPFLDGNGRVARLMSHSMLLRCGVGSSLWSVARGLARHVERYKSTLMTADERRHDDLDGRGALSERRLREFCSFFLEVSIDQVEFMESLLQPSEILRRMKLYVDDEVAAGRLPRGSLALLREAFLAGELERGRAAELTGYRERRGRQVLSTLLHRGLLVSQGARAPVRLRFPIEAAERLFPRLYPVG